jgi:predicted nucleic acid-binding protein
MASRLFLDANVILEYFLACENKEYVRNIFLQAESGIIKAFTSTSIVQTCGYILLKVHGKVTTRNILLGMLKDLTIIDCRHDTVIVALNSNIADLEDAIQ